MRRSSLALLALALVLAAAGAWVTTAALAGGRPPVPGGGGTQPPPPPPTAGALRLIPVATRLSRPVHVAQPAGEPGRLYIVEQGGVVKVLEQGRTRTFLNVSTLVSCCGERGLLSIAFSPSYATNRLFYIGYTDRTGSTVVAEYRTGTVGPPARQRTLLTVAQPYANHNGGQVAFGRDGFLYAGLGDGGSAGDPGNVAQNLSSQLGKLMRLNVSSPSATWEIVGYGLRNPWRFTFDRQTGDLWIGDVGQGAWEEIDFTPANSPGLENYGWRPYEGNAEYSGETPNPTGTLVFPIHVYSHSQGCSVTGGFVYRGSIASLRGRYVFGDFCRGVISSFLPVAGAATDVKSHGLTVSQLASFGEDAAGELYAVSLAGNVYRIGSR